jgi:hypothetical protein
MLVEQKATVGLNQVAVPARPVPRANRSWSRASQGIDKKLSSRAQKLAQVSPEHFEQMGLGKEFPRHHFVAGLFCLPAQERGHSGRASRSRRERRQYACTFILERLSPVTKANGRDPQQS